MQQLAIDVARLSLWLVLLTALFVPLERLAALHPHRILRKGLAVDIGFYFLNSLLPTILLGLPMSALVALTHQIVPPAFYAAVAGLPLWLQLVATFVVGEIGFYWGHRWSHESPLLWRFHAVHHAPEALDWLVNTRAHPVDMVFGRLCGLVPIYALGLAGHGADAGNLPAILFVLVGVIWGFFLHANVRLRLGWLEQIVASPRFHHWHHVRSGPIDRNYAAMLPAVDRVFGTLHLPARRWPDQYGLGNPPAGETISAL